MPSVNERQNLAATPRLWGGWPGRQPANQRLSARAEADAARPGPAPGSSTVVVPRLPRRAAPELPTGELLVDAPPEIPRTVHSRWQQLFQLMPMLTGTVATALMFAGRSGGAYSYVVGGIFGVSTLG